MNQINFRKELKTIKKVISSVLSLIMLFSIFCETNIYAWWPKCLTPDTEIFIAVVGDKGVGKTSVINRLCDDKGKYIPYYHTDNCVRTKMTRTVNVGTQEESSDTCIVNFYECNLSLEEIEEMHRNGKYTSLFPICQQALIVFDISEGESTASSSSSSSTTSTSSSLPEDLTPAMRALCTSQILDKGRIQRWREVIKDEQSHCFIEFVGNKADKVNGNPIKLSDPIEKYCCECDWSRDPDFVISKYYPWHPKRYFDCRRQDTATITVSATETEWKGIKSVDNFNRFKLHIINAKSADIGTNSIKKKTGLLARYLGRYWQ